MRCHFMMCKVLFFIKAILYKCLKMLTCLLGACGDQNTTLPQHSQLSKVINQTYSTCGYKIHLTLCVLGIFLHFYGLYSFCEKCYAVSTSEAQTCYCNQYAFLQNKSSCLHSPNVSYIQVNVTPNFFCSL